MSIRSCSHAGTWYLSNSQKLGSELSGWLNNCKRINDNVKAIIGPHAGYTYSGEAAAYGYIQLIPEKYKRIFILGPSHHVYMKNCGLTTLDTFQTPIGNLKVDKQVIQELYNTGKFSWTTKKIDEDEHSIEMHLPYIAKVAEKVLDTITIVPIIVGNLNTELEENYGNLLAPYFDNPDNFFVISSDFCHWGERFGYTHYDKSCGPIYKSIETLDKTAMGIIENGEPVEFSKYLKETKNTICGRHPIAVMLWTAKLSKQNYAIESLYYEQSSQVKDHRDSSVSYGVLSFTQKN